jgi:hypothetical protein
MRSSGKSCRGNAESYLGVIARSEATKQSIHPLCRDMDCFASLAMTRIERNNYPSLSGAISVTVGK